MKESKLDLKQIIQKMNSNSKKSNAKGTALDFLPKAGKNTEVAKLSMNVLCSMVLKSYVINRL